MWMTIKVPTTWLGRKQKTSSPKWNNLAVLQRARLDQALGKRKEMADQSTEKDYLSEDSRLYFMESVTNEGNRIPNLDFGYFNRILQAYRLIGHFSKLTLIETGTYISIDQKSKEILIHILANFGSLIRKRKIHFGAHLWKIQPIPL